MNQIQAVTMDDLYRPMMEKSFKMVDNYIYLYHTDTLIAIPLYPQTIQDSMSSNFAENQVLSRSAPIYSYTGSGPRSLQIELPLHRDLMNQINTETSNLNIPSELLNSNDYVDTMINQLQSAALPRYASSDKMINPPLVAIRFGNSIFCKGVINGPVTATHSGAILCTNKYSVVTVSFSMVEVDPYDADVVALEGGFRGIRTTLDGRVYKNKV